MSTQTLKLYAPLTYWEASEEERAKICNGCGAKDGLSVPSSFYGLCIKEACNIHDWMYQHGTTQADKLFADAMFRLNLTMIIDTNSNIFMAMLRQGRAAKYYIAVAKWGNKAYWINKTLNPGMIITFKGEFR